MMFEQNVDRKARCKFAVPLAAETGFSGANDPQMGARLVRAFLRIADPEVRLAIVSMVEKMGSAPADCVAPTSAPAARLLSCRVSSDRLKLSEAARKESAVHQLAATRL